MSEEKAQAIVDTIDIIAKECSRQYLWEFVDGSTEAAQCAERAVEAKQLLMKVLLAEEPST